MNESEIKSENKVTAEEALKAEKKRKTAGIVLFVFAAVFVALTIAGTVFSIMLIVELNELPSNVDSFGEAIGAAFGAMFLVVFELISLIVSAVAAAFTVLFSALALPRTKKALKVIDIVILSVSALCFTGLVFIFVCLLLG